MIERILKIMIMKKNDIWRTKYLKGERNGKGKEYYYNDYYNDLLKCLKENI